MLSSQHAHNLESSKIFLAKNLSLLRERKAEIIMVIKNPNRKKKGFSNKSYELAVM